MTLIVGIKCGDSVVLAADGAATYGGLGRTTIRQPTKKLHIIDDKIILGVSGAVGLSQRIQDAIATAWQGGIFRGGSGNVVTPAKTMALVSDHIRPLLRSEFEAAQWAQPVVGNNIALSPAVTHSLVAMPVGGKPVLFQFDHQGAPEEVNEALPFVTIGSGQQIADPFLGFIRRVMWGDSACPTVHAAVFAAFWTLQHAILVNPGGVADPIQIISMVKEGGSIVVKEYTEDELREHTDAIKLAEETLSNSWRGIGTGQGGKDIPEPATDS